MTREPRVDDDDSLRARIHVLTEEQHQLRSQAGDHDIAKLGALATEIDQMWDLIRQREALRDAGKDPAAARKRPADEVEDYLQ